MTNIRRTRRRVLSDCPMEEQIAALAESMNWRMTYNAVPNVETATDREVTWQVADGLALDYLETYLTGDCCVLALGESLDDAERLMESIESDYEESIFELGELLDNIEHAASGPEVGRALMRAGLGAPLAYEGGFFAALSGMALSNPDPIIREIAICAMTYTEWPQFVDVLTDIKENDPDEPVRVRATILLNAYAATGLGGAQ